jgi:hypothetical protein
MNLSEEQLHTLRHMLGVNTPYDREPRPYRNYAAVNPGDPKYVELERLGAVENCGKTTWSEYDYYRCTEAGKAAAIQSHRNIRYSKSKRRYWKFRDIMDCCPGLTFKEFLTNPEFKEVRRLA